MGESCFAGSFQELPGWLWFQRGISLEGRRSIFSVYSIVLASGDDENKNQGLEGARCKDTHRNASL